MGGAANEGFEMNEGSNIKDAMDQQKSRKLSTTAKPEKRTEEDFDELLEKVGSTGRYQKIFLYAVLGPITAIMPFFSLSTIFLLSEPDHWCHVPEPSEGILSGVTSDVWKNLTIPMETGPDGNSRFSQCSMYASDSNRSVVECQHGWDYDKTNYESTIPSSYDWVCSNSHYATTAFTVTTIGSVVGTIIFGHGADKFGRKVVFFATCAMDATFRLISIFVAHNFTLYLICQFMFGTAVPLLFITPTTIAAEICGKEFRGWIFAFSWMIWVVGMAILPGVAWLARTWFVIGLITAIPSALLLLTFPFVPESPRWLLSRGKLKEAATVMKSIASSNGTEYKLKPNELEETLKYLHDKENGSPDTHVGVWTLFSKPRLAKNTIMLGIVWSVNKLVYYGITLNSTHISGNEFLIFFILAVIELPAGYLGGILVEKLGRRWTSVVFFLVCTLACFAAIGGVSDEHSYITIICIVVAKFAITLTFLVVYMQGAEIFPTNLRSTGCSFASLIATVTNLIGPYLIYLGKLDATLPYVSMGLVSLIGLLAAAFIPETLNRNLPETLKQANDFGKHDKFWTINSEADDSKNKNKNSNISHVHVS